MKEIETDGERQRHALGDRDKRQTLRDRDVVTDIRKRQRPIVGEMQR